MWTCSSRVKMGVIQFSFVQSKLWFIPALEYLLSPPERASDTACRAGLVRAGLEGCCGSEATGEWPSDGSGPHFSVFSISVAIFGAVQR